MNTAGYDSKFATLYWPWIEVMDPTNNAAADSAVGPHGRNLGSDGLDAEASTRRRRTRWCSARTASGSRSPRPSKAR